MGPYAGVDYNLTLCPLQSRLEHIYQGQPYARVDLNPMPESIYFPSQGLWILPLSFVGCKSLRKARTRTHKINTFNSPNGKQNVISSILNQQKVLAGTLKT